MRTFAFWVIAAVLGAATVSADSVGRLYATWLAGENETLEGWRDLPSRVAGRPLIAILEEHAGLLEPNQQAARKLTLTGARACWLLSQCYANGAGGAPYDQIRATVYARLATDFGGVDACYYEARRRTVLDPANASLVTAFEWHDGLNQDTLAILGMHPCGQFLAGAALLLHGQSQAGMARLSNAADAGCLPAATLLGRQLLASERPRDAIRGLARLDRAADDSYLPAIRELIEHHAYPYGRAPNLARQRQLLRAAASLGDLAAYDRLQALPEEPLEELTVNQLYERFVAAWPSPVIGHDGVEFPPNPVLAAYPHVGPWLLAHFESEPLHFLEDPQEAIIMHAECARCGIGGIDKALHEVPPTLRLFEPRYRGPAFLMFYQYHFGMGGSNPRQLYEAITADFPPALRMLDVLAVSGKGVFRIESKDGVRLLTREPDEGWKGVRRYAAEGDLTCMRLEARLATSPRRRELARRLAAGAGCGRSALDLAAKPDVAPHEVARLLHVAMLDPATRETARARLDAFSDLATDARIQGLMGDLTEHMARHGEAAGFFARHRYIAGETQASARTGGRAAGVLHALCLLHGHGITADATLARELISKHAEDELTVYLMALLYEAEGDTQSMRWCFESAAPMFPPAAWRLGLLGGDGAEDWLKLSAEGGCLPGMLDYARLRHSAGDVDAARNWARKAATGGHAAAEQQLADWD